MGLSVRVTACGALGGDGTGKGAEGFRVFNGGDSPWLLTGADFQIPTKRSAKIPVSSAVGPGIFSRVFFAAKRLV